MRPDPHPGFLPQLRTDDQERGFTLIEVLVALVVASMILGIVMNAALQARTRAVSTQSKEEAVILARSLIAGRAVAPFDSARRSGQAGALRWQVAERRIAADPRGMFLLSEIDVSVRGAGGVALSNLKLRKLKAAVQP